MRLTQGLVLLLLAGSASAQQPYDLLLRGGHVIDPRNRLSAVRDVAIRGRQDRGRGAEDRPGRAPSRPWTSPACT